MFRKVQIELDEKLHDAVIIYAEVLVRSAEPATSAQSAVAIRALGIEPTPLTATIARDATRLRRQSQQRVRHRLPGVCLDDQGLDPGVAGRDGTHQVPASLVTSKLWG
jgi:predicted nucleic acid-binding protein